MNNKFWKILLLVGSLVGLAGCGENAAFTGSPDSTSTTGTTGTTGSVSYSLTASAPTPIMVVGTSLAISGTLLDGNGAPVASAPVTFTVDNGNFTGNVKYITANTDANGTATATLTAPVLVGKGTVTVSYSDQSQTVNLSYIAGAAANISLNASPSLVGVSSDSTLTTQLQDQYGNPIVNEAMQFSITTAGSGSPVLEGTGIIQTNTSGVATIIYTSGTSAGTDTINVTPLNGGGVSATTNITVSAAATTIASLTLQQELPSTSMTVGTTQALTATVLDNTSSPVAGLAVAFEIVGSGTIAGTKLATATTDANGVATVTLTAPILVGTASITASTAGLTDSVSLTYIAGVPASVTLNASPLTVGVSSDSTLTATVYDQYGNVTPGEPVVFSFVTNASGGTIAPSTGNATTNTSGVASIVYTSGTTLGTDTLQITVSNGTAPTATIDITVSAAASTIASVALAQELPTTSMYVGTTQTLSATVLDSASDPVAGLSVAFVVEGSGDIAGAKIATATTDASGIASVTLSAPILVGSATITASTSGLSSSISLTYKAGAPASVMLSANPVSIGVSSDTTLSATVYDQYGNVTPNEPVVFGITTNTSGGFFTPAAGNATTDTAGVATIVYTSGTTAGGTDVLGVNVTNGSAPSGTVSISISSGAVPVASKMTIRTDRPTVPSDNSAAATITATLLDSVNAVVPNTTVYFSSTGGVISSGTVVTDANGEASITLGAGTDPTNQSITVTASSVGVTNAIVPVEVVGSTVSITATRDVLITDGLNTSDLTIKVADSAGVGIYNVPVTLSIDNGAFASLASMSGTTNVNGEFTTTLTGLNPGSVVVTADAVGAQGSYSFTVDSTAASLLITSPLSGTTAAINVSNLITLDIPANIQAATLVTTLGKWDSNGASVLTVTNPNYPVGTGTVSTGVTSTEIGNATIRANDAANPSMIDEIQLIFVDEVVDATSTVSIQASPTTVPPSIGSTKNSSLLEVSVKNGLGTGIANAMVTFSMSNTTGSGEYVDPPVVYTDSSGTATANFYSGSQSSTSAGVQVTASLDETLTGGPVTDSVNIIINGSAGSISINPSTKLSSVYGDTMYSMPITISVTDSGGNPVPNTTVTLDLWPEQYGLGTWVCDPQPGLYRYPDLPNEDINKNLILDAGEDVSGNGQVTPPTSAAGTVPSTVTTDNNGVAQFELLYPKGSAGFVYDALNASTLVQGTETRATLRFWLEATDADVNACVLGESAFNNAWLTLSAAAGVNTLLTGASTNITATLTAPGGGTFTGVVDVHAMFMQTGSDGTAVLLPAPTLDATLKQSDPATGTATFTYTAGGVAGTDLIMIYYTAYGEIIASDYVYIDVQ